MNKVTTLDAVVGSVPDGAQVAFGGGGLNRKPLAVARAVGLSGVRDLTSIAFLGGPEVDLLIGLGKVSRIRFAYVGLDAFGVAPNFRRARQQGAIEAEEWSEFMVLAGLEAAARRIPFMPTRSGLGADLLTLPNSPFGSVTCPFTGTELVAVPALVPDVAFIHVNEADPSGNAIILGDAFADHLLARAAERVYLSAERIVDRLEPRRGTLVSRVWVTGVVEIPGGSGFTSSYPDSPVDLEAAAEYAAGAGDERWLRGFAARTNGQRRPA